MAHTCPRPGCEGEMTQMMDEEDAVFGVMYCSACYLVISEADLESGKAATFYG